MAHILFESFMHSWTLLPRAFPFNNAPPLPSHLLLKSSHTEAHCSKEPIHKSERHCCQAQRALHRREEGRELSADPWRMCVGCTQPQWPCRLRPQAPPSSGSDLSLNSQNMLKQPCTVNNNRLTKWLGFNWCQIKRSPVLKVGEHGTFGAWRQDRVKA